MNLNEKHKRLIDESTSIIPPGALEKYKKFVLDTVRPIRDPNDEDIRRAIWDGQMRYGEPK
jgi:hypothetical protein